MIEQAQATEALRRMRALLQREEGRVGGAHTRREQVLAEETLDDLAGTRIRSVPLSEYAPPKALARFVSREGQELLQEALALAHRLNEEVVGLRKVDAHLVLAGDGSIAETISDLRAWAESHASRRLAATRHRTSGSPVRRFKQLTAELGPWLEGLSDGPARIHSMVLGDVAGLLPWLYGRRTWVPAWMRESMGTEGGMDERLNFFLGWMPELQFQEAIDWLAEGMDVVWEAIPPAQEARQHLDRLAADLADMKGVLFGRDNPARSVQEVRPGVWCGWRWESLDGLGFLFLGPDERSLRAAMERGAASDQVHFFVVDHQGRLSAPHMGWITTEFDWPPLTEQGPLDNLEQPMRGWALHANQVVLEAVVDRLAPHYIRAVDGLARRAQSGAPLSDADLLATLADETDGPSADLPAGLGKPTPLGQVRLSRLVSVLERHFGVQAKPGKGSELKFLKPGCRMYVLGRHARNPSVGRNHIYRILRVFGISAADWAAAWGR